MGAKKLRVTPGWAVGWFFIPIAFLWMPYIAMKDLWRASRNPAMWRAAPGNPILRTWWALWTLLNLIGYTKTQAGASATDPGALRGITRYEILTQSIHIPLCFLAAILVGQIAGFQRANRQAPP